MTKIIAEFCQNHNGNFDLLKKMVESAARAGATHGKMQSIFSDTVVYRPQFEEGLVQNGILKSIKRPYIDEFNRLKGLEISSADTRRFIKICNDNGIIPMTTCFARSHVLELADLGFDSIKVASYDCASFAMLRDIAENFNEIVVSTGATYNDEVSHTAKVLKDTNFSFLHCVTIYPTPLDQLNLARMNWLKKFTPVVGFSDHSKVSETGLLASKAALALGANIIERHFTLLGESETRDGPVSINESQLRELVDFSLLSNEEQLICIENEFHEWKCMIGRQSRVLSDAELLNRDYYRGRFASPRIESVNGTNMIFNWEEQSDNG